MAEVTIKLDSPIITTDKSISEITTDGLANTGEIALASDGIVGNVNGKLRKYPNPIKMFYVEKFVATGAAKWGFEPKDVKTNDVVIIKTATESLMFTVAEATNTKATLCAFTKKGGTRIVFGQKIGGTIIGIDKERVADEYTGITYEYSLSEDLSLTDVNPFTIGQDALKCVPSYYTHTAGGKSYLKLNYNKEYLLPIGASYKNYNCVFYFIINHKGQQKLVALNTSAPNLYEPITTSLSFVDLVRIDALDNGDASASFVAGRNLKVNGWEFYWKDVWEESEPSAIKHIESAGVNAAINEIKGTGADVSAFTFPTTKDEFIAYLKTITFDFSNRPNQVSGYGSITYGIMNKNAGTTTIVEGMRNAVPDKIHRSHIEGQYMTFPDVEYALDCHVEGQDCNIVGYASICHLEGTGSAVVHSMGENVGFFSEAVGCHVEGGGGVAGGAYSHVEGSGCAALNFGAHCEGRGYYKNSVTDWKKRTAKDNDYLKDLWKKILFGKTDTSGYTYKFSAAIGHASHVEGMSNLTLTCSATLEGLDEGTTASFVNGANHAEGAGNLAGAAASHAEGIRNEIGDNAYASHAEGIKNITQNRAEHASGQYNKSNKATDTFGDSGNTLFSVGCGTSDADRKNAFEVMQDGTCKYLDVATGKQIDVGVAKELSTPFNLALGSTTKKVDGKSAVTFTAEEITDKFNGALIQKLTTASTEADIRKAFTDNETVKFPTPGSVITKLNGNNKGIVVSLGEPDATTLGRSIVVYYGDGTYTIVVKNDFTKVLVPWRKDSSLRDMYISAGAKYNEATGYYELNGLTDITEEEMRVIYEKTWGWWLHLPSLNGFGTALPRTNIPCPDYKIIAYASNISLNSIFSVSGNDDNLEVVNLRALYTPTGFDEIKIVDFNWAFQSDKKIKEVQGILNVKEARYAQSIGGDIETINIKGLKVNIRFYNSQRLSKESVLYIINHSEATSAITIGLNKAVYDVMKDDADIIAALAEKTNITLIQNT
nr:MAG TPA: hypothetical protein [Caudoviricetes sp.]